MSEDIDAQLRQRIPERLAAAGVSGDVTGLVEKMVETAATERLDTAHGDARLWATAAGELGAFDLESEQRERLARVLVGVERELRQPDRRVFVPGDEMPATPPRSMTDLDGAVWQHQDNAGRGTYRMSAKHRAKYGIETGVQVWPFLLDSEGPFSEGSKPIKA